MNRLKSFMTLYCIVICIVVGITFSGFFSIGSVPSDSMDGTITEGDCYFGKQIFGLNRGDTVIYRIPSYAGYEIGRIIGLPGEHVDITGSDIYIGSGTEDDPERLNETYIGKEWKSYDSAECGDKYYILGDNRRNALDSRNWGCISKEDVNCKIISTSSVPMPVIVLLAVTALFIPLIAIVVIVSIKNRKKTEKKNEDEDIEEESVNIEDPDPVDIEENEATVQPLAISEPEEDEPVRKKRPAWFDVDL